VDDDESTAPGPDPASTASGSDAPHSSVSDPGGQEPAAPEPAIPSAHPVVVYTALRLLLLAVVAGVLYLLQARGIWLILLSFLISGVISGVALSRRREGAAYGITKAVKSVGSRIDASARAEDVDDDSDFTPAPHDAAAPPADDGRPTA
jgi:hypothetical protein